MTTTIAIEMIEDVEPVGFWHIGGRVFIEFQTRPNFWRRFWHWFLLGWTWKEKLDD